MNRIYDTIVVGQGLAGTTLAWKLIDRGKRVLVIDSNDGSGASQVAAGLMTPVTGKRMVCSPSFQEEWLAAVSFYRQIEERLKVALLIEEPMVRLFDSEEGREEYLDRSDATGRVKAERWEGRIEANGNKKIGVEISPAGRVNVTDYLEASRKAFEELSSFQGLDLDLDDVVMNREGISVPKMSVAAKSLVLCQGAVSSQLFPEVPNNPAKGEIHKVRLEKMALERVVHRSIWLAPNKQESVTDGYPKEWLVGATYDWEDFDRTPTAKAEAELNRKLEYLIEERPKLLKKLVGIRPTMKDRQPVLGQHPEYRGVWIFNGLGSKGTLKAPKMADHLLAAMVDNRQLPTGISYQRLLTAAKNTEPLTTVAQQKISLVIEEGDVALDGTVGRGFDTSFLSKKVGKHGTVIGFDVQQEALEATQQRLKAIEANNVELFHQGHETVGEVLEGRRLRAAMFNLGYLPRSDKRLITRSDTTLIALEVVFEQLLEGGRMTLLCYRGHEGGPEEYEAVEEWLNTVAGAEVERIDSPVAKSTSPVLFVVTKRKQGSTNE